MTRVRTFETPCMSKRASFSSSRDSLEAISRERSRVSSIRSLSSGASAEENSASTRSLEDSIPSSRLRIWASSRRSLSAAANVSASRMIRSISDLESPPAGLICMPCALPVARSRAET